MHSSLVVTQEGLPLGLATIKFWTRNKFHGANTLKRKINPPRVPIEQKESYRWLEILLMGWSVMRSRTCWRQNCGTAYDWTCLGKKCFT
jgi:hypothetical protein